MASLFRLAMLLGKTVTELHAMPAREFLYWQAYLASNPPGQAEDRRAAAIMAQITNMAGRALPDRRTVTAADFLGGDKPKRQTMAEQIAFMRSLGRN